MSFITDQQTLDDLNIFGKHGGDSVYQIFNQTSTRGGSLILEDMFRYPLSDEQAINKRASIAQFFALENRAFPFESSDFDAIGSYLDSTDERTKLSLQAQSVTARLSNLVAIDSDTQAIHNGIIKLAGVFIQTQVFINSLEVQNDHPYRSDKDGIALLLQEPALEAVLNRPVKHKWQAEELVAYDALFRFRERDMVLKMLRYIYHLDVYLTLAKVARARNFSFPKVLSKNENRINLIGLYHPQVKNAVLNSIEIGKQSNVIFLTGANMAGKSTFMKSLSVALYLAHMGFPVPAYKMEFSVLDGMYTTINLPDDMGMGASHFYAEVLRVKKIAMELKTRDLFVLFDEMFRGTNVKDACEATIALTAAFAAKKNSVFVISTHIVEAGEVLKEKYSNINFIYLPTLMDGDQPIYTYKLAQGITADRHGMVIINNEGILDILAAGLKKINP
ncbi:MAG: DNA mismatch repair protein [Mucilaginibacter sp.]|uniref:MutS-related protein n=1 Tax=Mucilaginibacter sp. TaxID=1882438 RepID=UPI00326535D7